VCLASLNLAACSSSSNVRGSRFIYFFARGGLDTSVCQGSCVKCLGVCGHSTCLGVCGHSTCLGVCGHSTCLVVCGHSTCMCPLFAPPHPHTPQPLIPPPHLLATAMPPLLSPTICVCVCVCVCLGVCLGVCVCVCMSSLNSMPGLQTKLTRTELNWCIR